jgi:DNA-binding protein H-NS
MNFNQQGMTMTLENLKAAILQLPEEDCYALSELCRQQGDTLKEQRQQSVLKRQAAERDAILEKHRRELEEHGIEPTGALAKKPKPKKVKKEAMYKSGHIYQHPDNPKQEWNGHGKTPEWVRELEATGVKPVDKGIRPQLTQEVRKAG